MEECIRAEGAIPATVAILNNRVAVGLTPQEIERLGEAEKTQNGPQVHKVSRRDFAGVLASGHMGGTTVAATMMAAHAAGIAIFATGGIGGVHRGAQESFDISADLMELGA